MKGEKRPQPSPARRKEDKNVPSFDPLLHPLRGGGSSSLSKVSPHQPIPPPPSREGGVKGPQHIAISPSPPPPSRGGGSLDPP